MNGFCSCCHCFPHTHPRTVYPATFRVVLQIFPFPWGRVLTLPLYLCAPPCQWLLRWAACAVCLTTCQINAGVLWSHLKKELLHVKRRDGAQLDLTDGWIIHCKQLSCEVRIFLVEDCLETDCGYCVCMIYSCADASMRELRDTCALCTSLIG